MDRYIIIEETLSDEGDKIMMLSLDANGTVQNITKLRGWFEQDAKRSDLLSCKMHIKLAE